MVLQVPARAGERLYGAGMDQLAVGSHRLIVDSEVLHRSSCSCGVSLAVLLPHYPTAADVVKAFRTHTLGLENG